MDSPHKRPLTRAEVVSGQIFDEDPETNARLHRIEEEMARGFDFIESLPKSVTFFGSTRAPEGSRYYQKARATAKLLVHDQEFGIVTGGGPGIMEAANRGALEAGGISAGLTIELPTTQKPNPYINKRCDFHYFFTRKVILSFAARIYVFFPGGYGTMDEFFEIITLIQTNKIQAIPIVCVGAEFWQPMKKWINNYLLIQNEAIDDSDLGLFTITDNEDMVAEIASYTERRL